MNSPWFTPKEAAEYLRTTAEALEYRRRKTTGPAFSKVGKLIRYNRDELDRWLNDNRQEGAA